MIAYNLYPPFLYIPEESSFSDTWESFCLKLLKCDLKTNAIERRLPPEQGVDLYYKNQAKAYQCKSNLKNSEFNVTNAKLSLKEALKIKNSLPWEKYYLCSNSNLTGKQVTALQEIYSDVEVKGKDYWIGLCKNNPFLVQNDFRTLLNITETRINSDLNVQLNIKNLKSILNDNTIKVLFYHDLHKNIYELNLSKNMKCKDLLALLGNLLNFSEIFSTYDGRIRITHYFIYDGVKYYSDCSFSLCDIDLTDGSIITYWIKYEFLTNGIENNVMQFNSSINDSSKFDTLTKEIFAKFDQTLEE